MHLATKHSLLWEKHEIPMSRIRIMVLAVRQPERMGPSSGSKDPNKKKAVCVCVCVISRSCHGRLVAIHGTQIAASPTTAFQTPETSPALLWSSGSKLIRACLYHKDAVCSYTDISPRWVWWTVKSGVRVKMSLCMRWSNDPPQSFNSHLPQGRKPTGEKKQHVHTQ